MQVNSNPHLSYILSLALLFVQGFHGTLTRVGQAMDELAIVYWEACCLFTVTARRLTRKGISTPGQFVLLVAIVAAETALYSQMDTYPKLGWALYHPLHVSVSVATVGFLWTDAVRAEDVRCMRWLKLGIFFIIVGFTCWLVDMFACAFMLSLHLHLHAFGWHLFSAASIGCLHCAMACHVCRVEGIGIDDCTIAGVRVL